MNKPLVIMVFFFLFQLMLMKKGGELIYYGPLGRRSSKIIEYFEANTLLTSVTILYQFKYCHVVSIWATEMRLDMFKACTASNSVLIFRFSHVFCIFFNRGFLEFQKSKRITTLQHGCWKLLHHLLRHSSV